MLKRLLLAGLFFLLLFSFACAKSASVLDGVSAYTDWHGGSQGDLVIESDKDVYYGVTSSVMTFKIQNLESNDKLSDLAVLFEEKWANDDRVKVDWIKVLQENVAYQVPVTNCQTLTCPYTADSNTDLNGSVATVYHCKTGKKQACSYDSKTGTCSYRECTSTYETRYHDVWQEIPTTEPKNLNSKVNYKEWNGKKFHSKKGTKAFKDLGKKFGKGKTVYLQVKISYPINSSGEFAIATEGAFLDPWWNSNWQYRKELTVSNCSGLTDFQARLNIPSSETGFWAHVDSDADDLRLIDADDSTALSFWIEGWDYGTDANIWVKLNDCSTPIYLYYGNAAASDVNSGENTFIEFEEFEGSTDLNEGSSTVSYVAGKSGRAININGSSAYSRKTFGYDLGNSHVFEAWIKIPSGNGTSAIGGFFAAGDHATERNGYQTIVDERATNFDIQIREDYSDTGLAVGSEKGAIAVDTWYFMKADWNSSGGIHLTLYSDLRNTVFDEAERNDTTYTSGYFGLGSYDNTVFDQYRVRKWAATEPTFSIGAEETSNTAPSVSLIEPNGSPDGNYLSGSQGIVFDVNDADLQSNADGNLFIDIYYSSSQYGFENAIVTDGNLFDSSLFSCEDYNFSDTTRCTYSWDTTAIADGNYFIDLNVHDDSDANSIDSSDASFMVDNTAPSTTDDAPSGWQASDVNVHLTCSDGTGSGCSITQYRVNSGSWQTYDTNILFSTDGNFQLDYNSTDIAGNTETTNTVWVAVDKTAPSVGSTTLSGFSIYGSYIKGTGTIVGGTATDSASGVDTATCEYTSDNGSNWYSASWNSDHCEKTGFSISDGVSYTFNTRVKDNATNQGTGTATATYTGDTAPPTSTSIVINDSSGYTADNTPSLTLSATDSGSGVKEMAFSCNNSNWSSWVAYSTSYSSFNIETGAGCSAGDGSKTIYVKFRDNLDNESSSTSDSTYLDTTAPTTAHDAPSTWQGGDVTVTLSCNDGSGSGCANTYYCIDDSNSCTPTTIGTSVSVTCSAGSVCQKYVRFYSEDNVNNAGATTATNLIKIDKEKPTTSDNAPSGWQTSPLSFSLTPSDGSGSGVASTAFRVDSGDWNSNTTVWITSDGNHQVDYNSTDSVGNIESTNTIWVALDSTPPTASDNSDSSWHSTDQTITITPSDATSGVHDTNYCIDTTNTCTPSTSGTTPSVTCPAGSVCQKYVRYRVVDNAGNNSSIYSSNLVKIDKEKPSTTDNHPEGWQVSPFSFSLTPSDGSGSGVNTTTFRIDGGDWNANTTVWITSDGNHQVDYYSTDNAGNTEPTNTIWAALDSSVDFTDLNIYWVDYNSHASLEFRRDYSSSIYFDANVGTRATIDSNELHWMVWSSPTGDTNCWKHSEAGDSICGWNQLSGTYKHFAYQDNNTASGGRNWFFRYVGMEKSGGTGGFVNTQVNETVFEQSTQNPNDLKVYSTGGNKHMVMVEFNNVYVHSGIRTAYAVDVNAIFFANNNVFKHLLVLDCNSSYSTGDPLTSPFCYLAGEVNVDSNVDKGFQSVYYETDDDGILNGAQSVVPTEKRFIIFYSLNNAARGASVSALTATDTGTVYTSSDDGASWTPFAGTAMTRIRWVHEETRTYWRYYFTVHTSELGDFNSQIYQEPITAPVNVPPGITFLEFDDYWQGGTIDINGFCSDENLGKLDVNVDLLDSSGSFLQSIASGLSCASGSFGTTFDSSSVADGNYVLRAKTVDEHLEEATVTIDVAFDNSKPSTTIVDYNTGWQSSDQNIVLACSDGSGSGCSVTGYRIDSGAWQAYDCNILFGSDGNYQLDYNSTDNAGNVETTNTVWVAVDKTAPSTMDNAPSGWQALPFSFDLNASDGVGSGVALTAFRVDGGDWNAASTVWVLVDGNHRVDYNSTDSVGNVEATNTVWVALDSVAPGISLTSYATNTVADDRYPAFTVSASDAGSGVKHCSARVYKNGSLYADVNVSTCSYRFLDGLSAGDFLVVTWSATDNAGNQSSDVNTGVYTYQPPTGGSVGAGGGAVSVEDFQVKAKNYYYPYEGDGYAVELVVLSKEGKAIDPDRVSLFDVSFFDSDRKLLHKSALDSAKLFDGSFLFAVKGDWVPSIDYVSATVQVDSFRKVFNFDARVGGVSAFSADNLRVSTDNNRVGFSFDLLNRTAFKKNVLVKCWVEDSEGNRVFSCSDRSLVLNENELKVFNGFLDFEPVPLKHYNLFASVSSPGDASKLLLGDFSVGGAKPKLFDFGLQGGSVLDSTLVPLSFPNGKVLEVKVWMVVLFLVGAVLLGYIKFK